MTPPDVRLVWAPGDNPPSGAWWPRSHDAAIELRDLLPQAGEHLGGPVTRVSLNIDMWGTDRPRRLRVGDRLVRVGWFRTLDPATVTLGRSGDVRVTLRVVPPELDADAAQELLHAAAGSAA